MYSLIFACFLLDTLETRTIEEHYDNYRLVNTDTQVIVVAETNTTEQTIRFCKLKDK